LTTKLIDVLLSALLAPCPHYFVSHLDAPLQQHFLKVLFAQGKGVVEPDAVTDACPGKMMTGVQEQEGAL
jgi:hypothetical protein